MKLSHTRAMITAALKGELDHVNYETHEVFGVAMPVSCPKVPAKILNREIPGLTQVPMMKKQNVLAGCL
jgi:phosphoenolpyruvate carboxykinase (ATP)